MVGSVSKRVIMKKDASGYAVPKDNNNIGNSSSVLRGDGSNLSNLPSGFTDPMTTRGDLIFRNAANSTTRLGVGTTGQVLQTDGTDLAYATLDKTDVGLNNVANVDQTNADNITSGTLSADRLSTIAITKGGTGQTTATAGFDALAPTTTKADIIVNDGTNNVRVGVGADTQVLTADSTQASGVKWAAIPSGVSDFTALDDTPSSYSGQAGKVVAVNSGETALEFISGGGSTYLSSKSTGDQTLSNGVTADITDASVTISEAGTYLVLANFLIGTYQNGVLYLRKNTTDFKTFTFEGEIVSGTRFAGRLTYTLIDVQTFAASDVVKLRAVINDSNGTALSGTNITLIKLA